MTLINLSKPESNASESSALKHNVFDQEALNPATLDGFFELTDALGESLLPLSLRTSIAIALAERNQSSFCLEAHTHIAMNIANMPLDEIEANRKAKSKSKKVTKALQFAIEVSTNDQNINQTTLETLSKFGFNSAEAIEIMMHVALNTSTNDLTKSTKTNDEFPLVLPF